MRREERGEIRGEKDLEHQGTPGASQPWGDLSESPWGSLTYWSQDSTSSGSDSDLQPGIPDLVQNYLLPLGKTVSFELHRPPFCFVLFFLSKLINRILELTLGSASPPNE